MTEEWTFPPYVETIEPMLGQFGAEKLETYKGKDIRPLWDMTGGALSMSYKYLYTAPKIDKIVFAAQSYRDKLRTYTCSIWPDDEYALPIFSSFWAESQKGSFLIADFYPTADCIVNMEYMDHYLEPLDDAFMKALKDFDKRTLRDPRWFWALCSPYCITADFAPSTKETQTRLIETSVEYLEQYIKLWEKDEPRSPEYMKPLLERKAAIRDCMRENDPGGMMLEKAVGKELADLTLEVLF
jgi:hypothetical protein